MAGCLGRGGGGGPFSPIPGPTTKAAADCWYHPSSKEMSYTAHSLTPGDPWNTFPCCLPPAPILLKDNGITLDVPRHIFLPFLSLESLETVCCLVTTVAQAKCALGCGVISNACFKIFISNKLFNNKSDFSRAFMVKIVIF